MRYANFQLAFVSLAALLLAACASTPGTAPTATATSAQAGSRGSTASSATTVPATQAAPQAATDWQAQWSQVLEAAKREGAVRIFGTPQETDREAIFNFEKAYPDIRIEHAGAGFGDYEARVPAERAAGQYQWDVFIDGSGITSFTEHIPNGWYDPIKAALILPEVVDESKWLGGFDSGFLDSSRTYIYGFALAEQRLLWVNRDSVPEAELNSFQDLLKPSLAGKIAIIDPLRPSSGSNVLAVMLRALGPEGYRKLLTDQKPVFSDDRRQVADWVVRGRYPIGFGVSDNMLTPFLAEGLGGNVKPLVGEIRLASAGSNTIGLLNRGPNPSAAKVFVNWLLGPQAQEQWSKLTLYNSRRLDVPVAFPDIAVEPSRIGDYLNLQVEENASVRDEAIKLAQQLLH